MIALGTVRPGTTLRIPFDSFSLSTGAPGALSNFAVGDILVYKDSSTTERASTTGYTATTTFDSLTGHNEAIVDLSSDATADFFKAGSSYKVVISPVTIDGQTMTFTIATFDIGYPNALLNTSIATLASQTSFTLTSGPAEDSALAGLWCLVHDKASAVQCSWAIVSAYTGSTKTVTLAATPALTFTVAAIDNISFFAPMPLQPTTIGRALDVSTGGEAGMDWANVGSPTTSLALTGTTIAVTQKVDVDTIKTNAVVNGGTLTFPTNKTLASTDNITAGTITTVTNLTNAPTAGDFTATMKAATLARVTLVDTATVATTATNLTNAPTNGDLTATMKTSVQTAAAAALTAFFTSAAQLVSDIWSAATRVLTAATNLTTALATPTNITAGTITTVTNLTNAPTAGDLTATMKTSVTTAATAATPIAASVTGAVGSVTGNIGGNLLGTLSAAERNAIADAYLARTLGTEAVSVDGAVPTVAQAIFEMLSLLGEFSISGTTITCKKRDGSATLFTSTLDSSTAPTSRTRAT